MTNELMPITAKDMQLQVNSIQEMMKQVMVDGTHFGKVPGCGDKPALLKPGAEKIGLMFGLAAKFEINKTELQNGHREYEIVCSLISRSGMVMGQGVGCCSTMESKYRYRGNEVVSTGKPVPKAYWDNNRDADTIGGKGFIAQKVDGAWMICEKGEKKENQDIADVYNTVLKIGKKRAHVDAILTVTAASDIFTQDIEEMAGFGEVVSVPVEPSRTPAPRAAAPAKKGALQLAYDIPFNESKKLNPRGLGCVWDKPAKLWRGPEHESLLPYMVMNESSVVDADNSGPPEQDDGYLDSFSDMGV
jgi:hypothetical protein